MKNQGEQTDDERKEEVERAPPMRRFPLQMQLLAAAAAMAGTGE